MTPIHVVGIGLEGERGLTEPVRRVVEQAGVLVGSDRHLRYFPHHPAERLVIGNLHHILQILHQQLAEAVPPTIVILTSGDPLFFGLGRLLLAELPANQLTFHPHLSAIQLAFSRIKLPWQDAIVISAHGRSLDRLTQALQQGAETIAILTDNTNTPPAIAQLLRSLDLPIAYECWVCENLGGIEEQVRCFSLEGLSRESFEPLNVVVLHRAAEAIPLDWQTLPALGLPDRSFLSFSDRPGLMTKREIRLLILGELSLQPNQIVWDVGAGTGSVSVEIARLFPGSTIYAIEKTAAGIALIEQNCQRFQVSNIKAIASAAPNGLTSLPSPDRVFIGGSGGQLTAILVECSTRLKPAGVVVLALATLEHLQEVLAWRWQQASQGDDWQHHILQAQMSRSVAIGSLTRLAPLNPVTLIVLHR